MNKIDDIVYKVIEGNLTYKPLFYPCCSYLFNNNQAYEKNGFKSAEILLLDGSASLEATIFISFL